MSQPAGIRPNATEAARQRVLWEGGSERRKSGDRSSVPLTRLAFRGERRIPMSLSVGRLGPLLRGSLRFLSTVLLLSASLAHAGVIRGTVTDTTGATVKGATIVLKNGAKYVGATVSNADGSFQFVTGQAGRFSLTITADSFRQLDPPAFYAGASANVEKLLSWSRSGSASRSLSPPPARPCRNSRPVCQRTYLP